MAGDDAQKPGRKKKHKRPTRRLHINIDQELYEAFQETVESDGRTITYVITEFIKDYLKHRGVSINEED